MTTDAAEEEEHKVPCWLVWGLNMDGVAVLCACDLSQGVADRHRKGLLAESDRWIRVYVEPTVANHLYGGSMSLIRLTVEQVQKVKARDAAKEGSV